MRFVPPCTNCTPFCECSRVLVSGSVYDVTKYSFTVAGMTNDNCSYCNDWNGSFDLCWDSTNLWESAVSSSTNCGHTAGTPLWTLAKGATYYTLTMNGPGHSWRILNGSWVRGGTNILSLTPAAIVPNPCNNLPATITLTPCTGVCLSCSGGGPATMSADVSGLPVTSFVGCNYAELNGIYAVPRSATGDCAWQTTYEESCPGYYGSIVGAKILVTVSTSGGTTYLQVELNVWIRRGSGLDDSGLWIWRRGIAGSAIDCTAEYTMGVADQWYRWTPGILAAASWPTVVLN